MNNNHYLNSKLFIYYERCSTDVKILVMFLLHYSNDKHYGDSESEYVIG